MRNSLIAASLAGFMIFGTASGTRPASAADSGVTVASLPLLTFDPAFARTVQDLSIMSQVYSSLTTASFVDGSLVPNLAREWTDVDGKEFTFKLVPGAKFANGEPLDANAVVWNFKRLLDPATQSTVIADFNMITSVEAPDPTTVVIKTSTPWLELPRRLSAISFLAPEWSKTHNPKVEVNPSGPYVVVNYDFASHVTLKRNENFFGEKPAFENATYRVIGNSQTRVTSLRSGELNFANNISPLDVQQLSSLQDLNVGAIPGRRVHVLRFNMLRDSVKDVRVRQALNYAINKDLITASIYRGQTKAATTQVLIPGQVGFDETMKAWPYDPAKARQLLAEAGYAKGLTLSLGVSDEYLQAPQAAQAIAAQLAEVGVTIKLQIVPTAIWTSFITDAQKGTDLLYLGFSSTTGTSTELMNQFTGKGRYTWGPSNPDYDAAVEKVKTATSLESQAELIRKANRILADDAQLVYLWPQPFTYAVSKSVEWTPRADDRPRASDMRPAK